MDFAIPLKGENILDVCCGTGSFSYLIASRVGFEGQVIGLDSCKSTIKMAHNQTSDFPVEFLIANAESLPFISSKFDKCFVVFGLHHIPKQARRNALGEILRTLKSAGSLFIVEYNMPEKALAKLAAKALVKLDRSKEAYGMLINHRLVEDIEQVGFSIKRREFMYRGTVQLIEAKKIKLAGT